MPVKAERVKKLNTYEYTAGPVVYWMNRDIRAEHNWALLYAQEVALKHKVPLLVIYNLAPGFLGGGLRQYVFKLAALESVSEQLAKKEIPFFIVEGQDTQKDIVTFLEKQKAGILVTDFSPLRLQQSWLDHVTKHIKILAFCVDAHNIVPSLIASNKQEFGAYTLRPKLFKLLPEYLDEYPKLKKHPYSFSGKF